MLETNQDLQRPHPVFTIGHSNLEITKLINLLQSQEITNVIDVRSFPRSARFPDFNRDNIKQTLNNLNIAYHYSGSSLGGRPSKGHLYQKRRADYTLMAQEPPFIKATDFINQSRHLHRLALLCTEYDPINCHRTLLVAQALHRNGAEIRHILRDGSVETHHQTVARIMALHRIPKDDHQGEQKAIDAQSAQVAYQLKA